MAHKLYASRGLVLYDEVKDLISGSVSDGINWTLQDQIRDFTTETLDTLYTIKYANGIWMAAGANGTLIISTNNGLNWTNKTSALGFGQGYTIRNIEFGNNRWFVAGYSNIAAFSDDDGLTWVIVDPAFGSSNNNIRGLTYTYYNSQHRWIMVGGGGAASDGIIQGEQKVSISLDNGLSWNLTLLPATGTGYLHNVDTDGVATLLIASTINGGTLASYNGGDSWNNILINWQYNSINWDVKYANGKWMLVGKDGINIGDSVFLSNTATNDSFTRYIVNTLSDNNIRYISFSSINSTWICIGSYNIYKSNDNGVTWTEKIVKNVSAYDIDSNGIDWIISSNGGWMEKSSNDGENWVLIHSGNSTFFSVIYDGTRWITIGSFGLIAYSTNGKDWSNRSLENLTNAASGFYTSNFNISIDIIHDGSSNYIIIQTNYPNFNKIYLNSNDLINWTTIDLSSYFYYIKGLRYGDKWLIFGRDPDPSVLVNRLLTSTDGSSWTETDLTGVIDVNDSINDVQYNGTNLWMMDFYDYSTGNYRIATSPNGTTFTTIGLNPINKYYSKIRYENNKWYIFNIDSTYNSGTQVFINTILIAESSNNGSDWIYNTFIMNSNDNFSNINDVKYNGSSWIMTFNNVSYYNNSENIYITSDDSINWSIPKKFSDTFWPLYDYYENEILSIEWDPNNNYWLAVGSQNTILSSKVL